MVRDFHGRVMPEPGRPVGYAHLIERYGLRLPIPPRLAMIAQRHHPESTDDWLALTPRHAPEDTFAGHLAFALKWEGINLAVLSALFKTMPSSDVVDFVKASPTGVYSRRAWFLYEWLTGHDLDIPDIGKVKAVPVVDTKQQFALETGTPSVRHKVLDNLPGTPSFCPLVRRTVVLDRFTEKRLDTVARDVVGRTHSDVMARAAACLLLNDSKSSFWIEGEKPSAQRAARWGQAIGEAGTRSLGLPELERLQRIVIGDSRFVRLGLRDEGGFVGAHDRETREPIPDHISARPQDLRDLVEGIASYGTRTAAGKMDPVLAAAALSFGFVYVHPFEDGNGRLHRWLIHHVLAAAGYNPPGVVFPVSSAILRDISAYRNVLESYSRPLLNFIEWRPTKSGNVEVLNETADYYRYFDATRHAEFLYRCVEDTITRDLPNEVAYLEAYDRFAEGVKAMIEMPAGKVDLLHRFLAQNNGALSKRARENEFSALTDDETRQVEALHAQYFGALRQSEMS